MKTPFFEKTILLGVTGSIACYKAADLASKLTQMGARVEVILTQAAQQFITPLTFQSLTGRRAYSDADLWGSEGHVQHIGLGLGADLLVIAPASANTLAKLAHGIADNLLSVTALAARCPLIVAPAMDGGMYAHPATQANLEILRQRGVTILGPVEGRMASGLIGKGRMVEPSELLGEIRLRLARGGPLEGKTILVTAGGTQEPIDPVRVITNRSSGKQGYALAQAALDLGAKVILITTPTNLSVPTGAQCVAVHTAQEMLAAVISHLHEADVLIMAAAVADFRPIQAAHQKLKKEQGIPEIRLESTPDILAEVARIRGQTGVPQVVVGFAAESQALLENAQRKLEAKRLDFIVANDISAADAGFAVDTNRVTVLDSSGGVEPLPLMDKAEVAEAILSRVVFKLQGSRLVHICRCLDWQAAQQSGVYQADSLQEQGFIHASRPDQALRVANRLFHGGGKLTLLWIDAKKLHAPLRWESSGGETFPHIYGEINLEAVIAALDFEPDEDGIFRKLPEPEQ